jgi:hypothetical protein
VNLKPASDIRPSGDLPPQRPAADDAASTNPAGLPNTTLVAAALGPKMPPLSGD